MKFRPAWDGQGNFLPEHFNIEPDIMALAKGLAGGFPMGAILAKDAVAAAFQPGTHASTFGGNPLACAASVATLETLLEDGFLLDHCRRIGKYFKDNLEKLKRDFPSCIAEVRGLGLLIGMELTKTCGPIVESCAARGILINCTSGNVLRFTPPLIVAEKEIDYLIDALEDIFGR
jgi:acetylornithine/succinyldiaminopimelate/putrescine aminotransferase